MAKRKRIDTDAKVPANNDQRAQESRGKDPNSQNNEESITRQEIPFENKTILCARKNSNVKSQIVCTHGAGGTIDSPGMTEFLAAFPSYVCFQGSMNMKSRVKSFHAIISHFKAPEVLGGRSMGARAAVVAALERETKPQALILVSYPLTGGKEGNERQPAQREKILLDLPEGIDVLFVTGSEDKQCDLDLLREVMRGMKARTWLVELKGADHGSALKQKAGTQPLRAEIGRVAVRWLEERDVAKRYCAVAWDNGERSITSRGWESVVESEDKKSKKKKKT